MSRYCKQGTTAPILDAAQHWRNMAFLNDGSVFSDSQLWTLLNLETLQRYFIDNLDEGKGTFLDKLRSQLAPAAAGAKQLAAEMLWLMLLCPSNILPPTKRNMIEAVWNDAAEPLPDSTAHWLSDSVLSGVGSAGQGFNNHRWRELAFFITAVAAFKRQQPGEREQLLSQPWGFAQWLQSIPGADTRQLRHMLLFLLFPDEFERIFAKGDRQKVVLAFSGLNKEAVSAQTPLELDHTLRRLRSTLEKEYGTKDLDYYEPPLSDRWKLGGFRGATESITAAHVQQAIADIDRNGVPATAESTGYDLVQDNKRYPPKLVLSLAAKHATGEELDRGEFSGGEDSPAFRLLRHLGFDIKQKDVISSLVQQFLAQAESATPLSVRGFVHAYRDLEVKVSFGKGNVARIPWIAFLAKGQQVSRGIYPVLLLFRQDNVLLLCYGVSEDNAPRHSWEHIGDVQTLQKWYNARFGRNPDRYGASYVHAAYELSNPIPIQDLTHELDSIIDKYKLIITGTDFTGNSDSTDHISPPPLPQLEVRQDLGAAVESFSEALRRSFVSVGSDHDELVMSFMASLTTKAFVILTGLSGSGKTQIAIRFGEWLGRDRLFVAPVRPDWTGAEALFGYEDGLRPSIDGRPAWSVPAPLAFMLEALNRRARFGEFA